MENEIAEPPDTVNLLAEIDELRAENKKLKIAAKKTARELQLQLDTNERNRVRTAILTNLQDIATNEKDKLQRYLDLMLHNFTDMFVIFDHEGVVLFASDSFLNAIGISDAYILGKAYHDMLVATVNQELVEIVDGLILTALGEQKLVNLDTRADFGKNGDYKDYSLQAIPMLDDKKAICGAMIVFHDITDIAETNRIAETARAEAVRSSQAKSEFLSRMSHEMRTPMNAIIGMTAIGKSSKNIEKKEYCLNQINQASVHLLGVINDILDISKIEANKFELSYEEFEFENMLQKVADVITFRVNEKSQNFIAEIDPRIPVYIISDEQRLAQVVTNLLANAVKFTPEYGKIYLKAELEEITGGECVIRVSVKDTGIGISEEQQQQLFKSFQQADTGISRRFGGTGLGLAISRNIVELMNGKIWIESELEKGAAFIFRIKAKIKTLETRAWDWKGINAVVAEDSAGSTGYAADILKMYGASCVSFGDPQDALDFIASNKTDIVIIDMSLKGMNGFEFSKRLMSAEKKTRAVIVSSADNSEYAEELSALGIDSFLQKPILPKALSVFINDYLRRGAEAEDDAAACEIENVFEGKHALIAEDVDVNREIIQTITEDMGLRITFAADGAQAVRTFENTRGFDIILMDINMPNMDGHTAARRIREIERERGYAPAPIMAMTANVFREDIEKCLESGMNDHLGKPLDIEELYRKLKKHLLN